MSAILVFNGKLATHCQGAKQHSPVPHRFVWHHLLPEVCGGKTTDTNVVQLCDNCHITVHAALYALANNTFPRKRLTAAQLDFAEEGYNLAKAAGVLDKVPNEGGHV